MYHYDERPWDRHARVHRGPAPAHCPPELRGWSRSGLCPRHGVHWQPTTRSVDVKCRRADPGPPLHRDWAGLGSPRPPLRRDWAHPGDIGAGTGPQTPGTRLPRPMHERTRGVCAHTLGQLPSRRAAARRTFAPPHAAHMLRAAVSPSCCAHRIACRCCTWCCLCTLHGALLHAALLLLHAAWSQERRDAADGAADAVSRAVHAVGALSTRGYPSIPHSTLEYRRVPYLTHPCDILDYHTVPYSTGVPACLGALRSLFPDGREPGRGPARHRRWYRSALPCLALPTYPSLLLPAHPGTPAARTGHIYYFFDDVYPHHPSARKRRPLATPKIMYRLFGGERRRP